MHRTAALLVLAALCAGGCAARAPKAVVPIRGEGSVAGASAPAVDVQNAWGAVCVRVDPEARGPRVQANPIEGPSKATPDWVAAEIVPDQGRAVLRVLAVPGEPGKDQRVYILVTVPACSGVRVRNAGGEVTLENVSGAIQVENGGAGRPGGDVIVRTAAALTDHVALRTTAGHVRLTMAPGSAGEITATAPGAITFNTHKADVRRVHAEAHRWRGVLANGSAPMVLETESGSVFIAVE